MHPLKKKTYAPPTLLSSKPYHTLCTLPSSHVNSIIFISYSLEHLLSNFAVHLHPYWATQVINADLLTEVCWFNNFLIQTPPSPLTKINLGCNYLVFIMLHMILCKVFYTRRYLFSPVHCSLRYLYRIQFTKIDHSYLYLGNYMIMFKWSKYFATCL